MKTFVRTMVLFLALFIQTTITSDMKIFGVVSNLFIVVLLYTVSVSDMPWAIGYGAASGALIDLLGAKIFGVNTLLCLFFAIVVCYISNGIRDKRLVYYLIATFLFTGLYEYLTSVFFISGSSVTLRWAFVHKVLPTTIMNTLWLLPVYWLLHRPLRKFYEERKITR